MNTYTVRLTFKDYDFKCQFFKEAKEDFMNRYQFKDEDEVPQGAWSIFESMVEVESHYKF